MLEWVLKNILVYEIGCFDMVLLLGYVLDECLL